MSFFLISCGTLTPEEIKHEQWKQEQYQIEQEKDRVFQLEQMKIQAEIEKAKPVEVKLQETKNQETSIWDGIESIAIGATIATIGLWLLNAAR